MLKSYIKEATATAGTGDLTLTALTGFARFLGTETFVADSEVLYAIENGDNKETGIGTIRAGNILERTTPFVTLVAGVYDATTPTQITLVGDSIVFCDINNPASSTVSGFLSSTDYATLTAKIGGSGATNTVPKFTGVGTIGNSSLSDDGVNVTATGTNVIPSANNSKDLGTSSLRWRQVHTLKLFNVTGVGTHTIGQIGSPLFGITAFSNGSLINNAKGGFVGGTCNALSSTAGTTSVYSTANSLGYYLGNFTWGAVSNLGASTAAISTVGSSGTSYGSFTAGYAWTQSSGAQASQSRVKTNSGGCFTLGYTFSGGTANSQVLNNAGARGAFTHGMITGNSASGTRRIQTSALGAFCQGYVGTATTGTTELTSAGRGAFCQGSIFASNSSAAVSPSLRATGEGSFAQGSVYLGIGATAAAYILASGKGSFAHGSANANIGGLSGNIKASGIGSFACGYAPPGSDIFATVTNSFQFGPGTNATANSFQFGTKANVDFGSTPGVFNVSLLTTGFNFAFDTTTGAKLGTATTQKIGFWNATPIVRPSAFTQTFATAIKTHAALTSATLTDSSGGTANATVAAVAAGADLTTNATINDNFADVVAQINALRVDVDNTKQVLNAVIDDFQLEGLLA